MATIRVLFCDDSGGVLKGFENNVSKPLENLVEAHTSSSIAGVEARIAAGEMFDIVVTDLNFEKVGGSPRDGLEILRLAREHWQGVEPILMTAYEGSLDVRDGLRLRGLGVNEENLLAKTDAEDPGITWLRLRERIQGIALRKQAEAKEMQTLKRENRYLRETVAREVRTWILSQPLSVSAAQIESDPDGHLGDQIGRSFVMKEVFRRLRRAAVLPSDVLILGPTGTGKDLVARSIHKLSARANQPFVKADLTTTTQNLLESELFGHERGAFTGADARKEGLLALADKGTFFLDEIGNISPEVQAKLLRVLEDRRFRPLGSQRERAVDVRVIAATNEDLSRAVDDGSFRADLFERLNVLRIALPSLAERSEDIPLLVAVFVTADRQRFGVRGLDRITPEALDLLMAQPWPRNVRQLKHVIERVFSEADTDAEAIDARAIDVALAEPGGRAAEAAPAATTDLFRRVLAREVSLSLPDIKRKFGEDATRDVIRKAMVHFRGLPSAEECDEYFGGCSPNAWRQFAFQLGLTWKSVKGSSK